MSNLPDKASNSAVAVDEDDDDLLTGLEDFDTTDFVTPRLKIDGKQAKFVDTLSGAEYDEVTVVLLGLVKQRILWAADIDDADAPLCKSLDFRRGMPDPLNYPWKASGFAKGDTAEDGTLACEACALKEWGSHPKQETPWCSEQHTFPLLHLDEDGNPSPAILTVQRSGIKPSKAYLTAFAKSKTPMFTVVTKIALTAQKRGSVDYAVPKFTRLDATDEADWPSYRSAFRQMRDFLQTPRTDEEDADTSDDDDDEDEDDAPAPKPQAKKKSKKPKPTPKPVEVDEDEDEDEDDLPF